jgi:hypothetical protein
VCPARQLSACHDTTCRLPRQSSCCLQRHCSCLVPPNTSQPGPPIFLHSSNLLNFWGCAKQLYMRACRVACQRKCYPTTAACCQPTAKTTHAHSKVHSSHALRAADSNSLPYAGGCCCCSCCLAAVDAWCCCCWHAACSACLLRRYETAHTLRQQQRQTKSVVVPDMQRLVEYVLLARHCTTNRVTLCMQSAAMLLLDLDTYPFTHVLLLLAGSCCCSWCACCACAASCCCCCCCL